MAYGNPYGAVPAALEATRLSLRDIMSDYLRTKVEEGNLRLAEARMNMEQQGQANSLVLAKMQQENEGTRMRLDAARSDQAALADAARLGLQSREMTQRGEQFEKSHALDVRKFEADERHRRVTEAAARAQVPQRMRLGDMFQDKDTGARFLKTMGLNPDITVTSNQVMDFAQNHHGLWMTFEGMKAKSDLDHYREQLANQNLTAPQRSAVLAKYRETLDFAQTAQALTSAGSEKKLRELAIREHAKNPEGPSVEELMKEYGNYNSLAQLDLHKLRQQYDLHAAGGTDEAKARKLISDNLIALKRQPPATINADQAASLVMAKLDAGDLAGAYRMSNDMRSTGKPAEMKPEKKQGYSSLAQVYDAMRK